jgi:hypothetical protein
MTKEKLIEIGTKLGLSYYNECEDYVCFHGVNGHSSLMYTTKGAIKLVSANSSVSTYSDFAEHLKQMGRDSLKIELHTLLSINTHA